MSTNKAIKVGDLVRVSGHSTGLPRRKPGLIRHHFKSGTVGYIVSVDTNGDLVIKCGDMQQIVRPASVKLAKQAMRKRDEYLNRR